MALSPSTTQAPGIPTLWQRMCNLSGQVSSLQTTDDEGIPTSTKTPPPVPSITAVSDHHTPGWEAQMPMGPADNSSEGQAAK